MVYNPALQFPGGDTFFDILSCQCCSPMPWLCAFASLAFHAPIVCVRSLSFLICRRGLRGIVTVVVQNAPQPLVVLPQQLIIFLQLRDHFALCFQHLPDLRGFLSIRGFHGFQHLSMTVSRFLHIFFVLLFLPIQAVNGFLQLTKQALFVLSARH